MTTIPGFLDTYALHAGKQNFDSKKLRSDEKSEQTKYDITNFFPTSRFCAIKSAIQVYQFKVFLNCSEPQYYDCPKFLLVFGNHGKYDAYLSDKVFWPPVAWGFSCNMAASILRFFFGGAGDWHGDGCGSRTGLLVPLCAFWLFIQWSTIRLAATCTQQQQNVLWFSFIFSSKFNLFCLKCYLVKNKITILCKDKIKGRDFLDLKCIWIIPLSPQSDQHQHAISPYNIAIESNVKVMRIKKLITE